MRNLSLSRALLLVSALALPGAAIADVVVLTPLIPSRGVDDERVTDIFTLMSSELEFLEGVDEVVEVMDPPPALTIRCLDSTRCLAAITKENAGDTLLAGAVEEDGDDLVIDLVYFDANLGRTVRRKTWTLPDEPSALINQMTPILAEAITGVSPVEQQKADSFEGMSFDDAPAEEDDFYVGTTIEPAPVPREEPTRAGTTRAVDQAIVAPPVPDEEESFDPGDFSFGDSAEDISFGDSSSDISYAEEEVYEPPPPPPRREVVSDDLLMEEELDDDPGLDLDEDRGRYGSTSSTSRKKKGASDERLPWAYVYLRGGYSNYGVFNFGVASFELQGRAIEGLTFGAGVDAWIVSRCVPIQDPNTQIENPRCGQAGLTVQTAPIWPISASILYRFDPGKMHPYVGGNVVASMYLTEDVVNEEGTLIGRQSYWSIGFQVRAGFDYMVAKNFGLNVDLRVGYWGSSKWKTVDPRLPNGGVLPTATAGILIAF